MFNKIKGKKMLVLDYLKNLETKLQLKEPLYGIMEYDEDKKKTRHWDNSKEYFSYKDFKDETKFGVIKQSRKYERDHWVKFKNKYPTPTTCVEVVDVCLYIALNTNVVQILDFDSKDFKKFIFNHPKFKHLSRCPGYKSRTKSLPHKLVYIDNFKTTAKQINSSTGKTCMDILTGKAAWIRLNETMVNVKSKIPSLSQDDFDYLVDQSATDFEPHSDTVETCVEEIKINPLAEIKMLSEKIDNNKWVDRNSWLSIMSVYKTELGDTTEAFELFNKYSMKFTGGQFNYDDNLKEWKNDKNNVKLTIKFLQDLVNKSNKPQNHIIDIMIGWEKFKYYPQFLAYLQNRGSIEHLTGYIIDEIGTDLVFTSQKHWCGYIFSNKTKLWEEFSGEYSVNSLIDKIINKKLIITLSCFNDDLLKNSLITRKIYDKNLRNIYNLYSTENTRKFRIKLKNKFYDPKFVDKLDKKPLLLNLKKNVIDLTTGNIINRTSNMKLSKFINIKVNKETPVNKQFSDFIKEIMCNNKELITVLRRTLGYIITGLTKEQVCIFSVGNGSNGKGVLSSILAKVLKGFYMTADAKLLSDNPNGNVEALAAELLGARLAVLDDPPDNFTLGGNFKNATGDNKITAKKLYQDPIEFTPTHKFWVNVNSMPNTKSKIKAIVRRLHPIPFMVEYLDKIDEIDMDNKYIKLKNPSLKSELLKDKPGILKYLMECAKEYLDHGLIKDNKDCNALIKKYIEDNDWSSIYSTKRNEFAKLGIMKDEKYNKIWIQLQNKDKKAIRNHLSMNYSDLTAYRIKAKTIKDDIDRVFFKSISYNKIKGELENKGCIAIKMGGEAYYFPVKIKENYEKSKEEEKENECKL